MHGQPVGQHAVNFAHAIDEQRHGGGYDGHSGRRDGHRGGHDGDRYWDGHWDGDGHWDRNGYARLDDAGEHAGDPEHAEHDAAPGAVTIF